MFEKHRETPNFGMKFVKFWSIKTLFGNKIKLNKMKALRFIPIIALMVFASCSAIFMDVVVLPEPEGPDSRTMGLFSRLPRMSSAASATLF